MNLLFKRSLQLGAAIIALSTSACVVDPYYSGISYDGDYGTTVHPTNTVYTQSATTLTTGFLIGNAYYWNDHYYPVNYYTHNNRRYYRPDFNRPNMHHPDNRYRHLNAAQMNHWRRNQAVGFDPRYRPNLNQAQRREILRQQQLHQRPNADRPHQGRPNHIRPNETRPNMNIRPNQSRPQDLRPHGNRPPQSVRPQPSRPTQVRPNTPPNRPHTQPPRRPQSSLNRPDLHPSVAPNLNAAQRQAIIRSQQQRERDNAAAHRLQIQQQNRRMNER